MNSDIPYGRWRCAEGREVLFNREYEPLWSRSGDGEVLRADAGEWVEDIVGTEWFFDDATSPLWMNPTCPRAVKQAALARALGALQAWGLTWP